MIKPILYVIEGDPVNLSRSLESQKKIWDEQKAQRQSFSLYVAQIHQERPFYVGPLELSITFYMKLPKNLPERKNLINGDYHYFRPDLSAMLQFVEKNCEEILYNENSSLSRIIVQKVYDKRPRTEFTIIPLKVPDDKKT